jgi:hypothetical protein
MGQGVAWWIGDWLRYGNLQWGERYARASRIIGYDPQTLMNMAYVASSYPPHERRPNLSWSHHAELAVLEASERRHWMDIAEEQRMSVRCLRQELRRARQNREQAGAASRRGSTSGHDPEVVRCPQCGFSLDHSADIEQERPAA